MFTFVPIEQFLQIEFYDMTRVYKNNFRFIANRYEEWQAGRCISHGPIRTEILAEVSENSIHFELNEIDELRILQSFDFMCGDAASAILRDRVQYSNATSDFNPIVPIVCHLFYSGDRIEYVRFAMTNPDRLIEFYGDMIELGQPSTGVRSSSSNNIAVTADDILEELDGYGMLNVDTIMERATRLYNDNANVRTIDEAEKVSESLKLFVEAYNLEREKMEEDDKDYSVWMPKILMFIALTNYKIGNINGAYEREELVGFVIFEPASGDISSLAVAKDYRRKGIGKSVLKSAVSHVQSDVLKFTNVDCDCESVTGFLSSLGLTPKGQQFEMVRKI